MNAPRPPTTPLHGTRAVTRRWLAAGWLAVASAVGSTAGCGAGAGPLDELETLPVWALDEELRIGSVDDPDVGFSAVGGMAVGVDGLLYVMEGRDRQVRVYDAAGRLLRVIGAPGQGPGEIQFPSAFGLVGDTVWVRDTGNRRVTLLSTDGRLLDHVALEGPTFPGRVTQVTALPGALEPEGTFSCTYSWTLVPGAPGDTVAYPLLRFGRDGQIVDTIGWDTLRLAPRRSLRAGGVEVPMPGAPFNDDPLRYRPDQCRVTMVVDRAVASSDGPASFSVTELDEVGDTIWSRSFAYRPMAMPPARADTALAAAGRAIRARGVDSVVADRAVRGVVDVPAFLPPVTRVMRSDAGEVWLLREDDLSEQRRWTILDATGQPIGQTHSPRSLRVHVLGADHVWGVETDALGVPWVVRYRIIRDRIIRDRAP